MNLKGITFDESDKNLFQVDDPRLRADALKHSIIPRLRCLLNECISMIRRIYEIEVLEDSIISYYPHFRSKRQKELKLIYENAYVGLGGRRVKGKWLGLSRKDGKPVQIPPFRYGISITGEGLFIYLENCWIKGLTDRSYGKLFDFHLKFESLIHVLCYRTNIYPILYWGEGSHRKNVNFIATFTEHYKFMYRNGLFDNDFISYPIKYPVTAEDLDEIVLKYAIFYPIYDSYVRISMKKSVQFTELLEKLNTWCLEETENTDDAEETEKKHHSSDDLLQRAKQAAEKQVRVMPALRWQVFKRDGWRCVACGRGSQDNVILHVDHIIPRSKGGKDTLDNYQTLCHICNIGKSNKDSTNLRARDKS